MMPFSSMKMFFLLCLYIFFLLSLINVWKKKVTHLSIKDHVTILLWYWPYGKPGNLEGDVCWDLYRIARCKLVDDRSLFQSANVVVFHNRELVNKKQRPPTELQRPPGQRWAWLSLESPAHNGHLQNFKNIFNITISYRRDADITVPYGELLPLDNGEHQEEERLKDKRHLVCWVVSKFWNHHRRSRVYKEIQASVPVEVYGHWKKRPLSFEELLPTISRCYFYLAFENSEAKDYITEKLWRNAYLGGAVPVVLGPSINDYKAVAPNHSFIHVDQFTSMKQLGHFLQQLSNDKKGYTEYFNWKKQWRVKVYSDWRERLCKVCLKYNDLPHNKVYSNLDAWNKAPNA